jgi:hypothetical protein
MPSLRTWIGIEVMPCLAQGRWICQARGPRQRSLKFSEGRLKQCCEKISDNSMQIGLSRTAIEPEVVYG